MLSRAIPLCTALLALTLTLCSQELYDYGFVRSQNTAALRNDEQPFSMPWAGGINGVRFSEIDLNLDGVPDLVAFEKHGNRILPFVNCGFPDTACYRFAPQYAHNFPPLHNWVILKDYNCDGKQDIFTYGLAGISVYENVSTAQELRFQLVTNQLTSFYYNSYTNLYSSPDDYLAVEDVDGDGDLDILNFWVLGRYVHFHRNYSMENYGDCSHLEFRLEDECWGHFEEGAEDNSLILNSDCGRKEEPTRHVGSTFLVYDFTGNGLSDLVLGDMDYPNLLLLRNGGTHSEALMVSVDTLFPNPMQPIWLYSMPVPSFVDVDNDGVGEILASPADPSLAKSQDCNSVWIYHWDDESAQYQKVTENFLQGEMVDVGSGAAPVLYDWNQDGLPDLFVANYGKYDSSRYVNGILTSYYTSSIAYFQNVGNGQNPVFQLVTDDFGDLRQYGYKALYPAFADLSGDGIPDLLCGNLDGKLLYFENLAPTAGDWRFAAPQSDFADVNVGGYSTPQLFDLDLDGRFDLLIGNRRGKIAAYRNISTTNIPDFQFVTDNLGGVDVRDYNTSYFGHSVPCFFRDSSERTALFCGSEQGYIFHYDLIDSNLDGDFRLRDSTLVEHWDSRPFPIDEGIRTAVAVADLNHDGFLDMVVGNYAGGLSLFMGTTPLPRELSLADYPPPPSFRIYPNPTSDFAIIEVENSVASMLQLFDITGRLVATKKLQSKVNRLNVSGLQSGVYVGRIMNASSCETFRIVIGAD